MDENDVTLTRAVHIGGMTKVELLFALQQSGIQLNDIAKVLFAHQGFTTAEARSVLKTVEVSVGELGHTHGATIAEIFVSAAERGLSPCPLELAGHFRLQFTDQPEGSLGYPPSEHRAPPGSLTIASTPLAADGGAPMGFYLRRIRGALWLRGYRSPAEHIWDPGDRFVFCLQNTIAAP